jgi:hypothetical protein
MEPDIGLVGYSAPTGLGELNRQIAEYLPIHRWLVKPHKHHGHISNRSEQRVGKALRCVMQFLAEVDIVLFCETPYFTDLVPQAAKLGKGIVCVPMLEWLPPDAYWPREVDLFICPTEHSYQTKAL